MIEQFVGDGDLEAAIELLKAVNLCGEVGVPQGLTDPEAILKARAESHARRELGDESPLKLALRGLDGGKVSYIPTRTQEHLDYKIDLHTTQAYLGGFS